MSEFADMKFVFRLSAYDIEKLKPQVASALERRSELVARLKHASKKTRANAVEDTGRRGYGGFHRRSSKITLVVSSVSLVLGTAFLIGGVALGNFVFFLALGVLLLAAGVYGVISSRRGNPYERDAAKLLDGKDKFLAEDDIRLVFSDVGMRSQRSFIPYKEFQCWMETDDLFMLIYGPLVTILQKHDLIEGELNDFRRLITKYIPIHARIKHEQS
ncbi:MAG TPA: YcxB family protein [Candidatus Scatomorpha merdipullorum]|uniref:YcxB family protein n=1 Tax=Candidatus Scatomorpha merdipullorum TaxID=2840927 RepID=A0A9D1FCE0_9FIRM|nr:YcxB family protein [Candidatus Scatomorpha merdipullorum]